MEFKNQFLKNQAVQFDIIVNTKRKTSFRGCVYAVIASLRM